VLFIRGNDRDNSVNILRNLIRKYLSNPPDSRFQNTVSFLYLHGPVGRLEYQLKGSQPSLLLPAQ
jgi:hypothetical protein